MILLYTLKNKFNTNNYIVDTIVHEEDEEKKLGYYTLN